MNVLEVVAKVLGTLWALPLSLLGGLAAVLGGGTFYRMRPWALQFTARHGLWAWFFKWRCMGAITIGSVTIFQPQFADDAVMIRHERQHTYQAMVLGLIFPFAYYGGCLVALLQHKDLYRGNWFEVNAYAAEKDIQS